MSDQWYKYGAGFLLVYSITDRPTFEALPGYHEHILRVKDKTYVPCVVVSNKVSLDGICESSALDTRADMRSVRFVPITSSWTIGREGYG